MGFFLRLILTGLGWSFGGPLGAIIGYAIGGLFSSNRPRVIRSEVNETFGNTEEKRDFNVTLLVLSAAVMKADGNVRRSELDYVKRFFLQNFGQERAESYIKMLREILEKDYNLYEVSQQVGRYMDYSSRLQLLHYLFGIDQGNRQRLQDSRCGCQRFRRRGEESLPRDGEEKSPRFGEQPRR